jgi:hypothetical protein
LDGTVVEPPHPVAAAATTTAIAASDTAAAGTTAGSRRIMTATVSPSLSDFVRATPPNSQAIDRRDDSS